MIPIFAAMAALLDSTPPAFTSQPSDILGLVMAGCIFLLLTWVFFVIGKNFQAFVKGIAWVLGACIVAAVLIAIFQAGHPGQ